MELSKAQLTGIITLVMILAIIPVAFAGWGDNGWGEGGWGEEIIVFTVSKIPSGGGGTPTFPIPIIPSETESINNTCSLGWQLLDTRCYACNPERGYLKFNPEDRSVLCIECPKDFYLQNSTCHSIAKNETFYDAMFHIGNKLNPDNPKLAISIVILGLGLMVILGYDSYKKNKRKPEEMEEEE